MSRSELVSVPPNYRLLAGNEDSTVLMHVPHASTEIPAWVRDRIILDDQQLDAELSLMTDAQTELIATRCGRTVFFASVDLRESTVSTRG
jgi:hypothetical protein